MKDGSLDIWRLGEEGIRKVSRTRCLRFLIEAVWFDLEAFAWGNRDYSQENSERTCA